MDKVAENEIPEQEPAKKPLTPLEMVAEQFGVETEFWDIFGERHHASEPVLRAILGSFGVDTSSDESLLRALERKQADGNAGGLPKTLVVSQSSATLSLPAPAQGDIQLEDGTVRAFDSAVGLAEPLPLGYHRLRIGEQIVRLIVCPDRAYQPEWMAAGKAAGIALSLYGVRSGRNWGCGDCGDLPRIVDWVADDLNASFIALNPLHAIPNRQPYNTSPYLPNSIFYRNHIYLDIEAVEDFQHSAPAVKLLAHPKVQAELQALRGAEYVEYERISRLKLLFLRALFRAFLRREHPTETARGRAFEAYSKKEGRLLHLFAMHSALDEAIHKKHPDVWNFQAWPEEYRDPASEAVQLFARRNWRRVMFHKYVQWQLDLQFERAQACALERGMKIGLYHDLALATDRFGCDLWAHREFFANGCRVGSPPDDFSPKGQDWSFPPPNSERHFEDGYRLFAESIRKAAAHGGALRIDHVMRFFRLYWIPDGMEALDGTYVKDRYQDLVRVLSLESVRGKFMVIGEDLGTVPDIARETLKTFGILSYRLFYFERDSNHHFYPPSEYPRQALVSASTHDLPTLVGFWEHADIEARRAAGVLPDDESVERALVERAGDKQKMLDLLHELHLLPDWFPRDAPHVPHLTGELHNAIVGFLAETPSDLMGLNQEDLFKDPEQQNLPGTTAEHPNWRHKMKYTAEELRGPATRGYNEMLRNWLKKTGRGNTPPGLT
jgi:4-alpha-glucanotransferase